MLEYEKEARLIYYSKPLKDYAETGAKMPNYISLDNFKIEAVYLGYLVEKKYITAIKKAIGKNNIELYKMEFDPSNITRLVPKRIKRF